MKILILVDSVSDIPSSILPVILNYSDWRDKLSLLSPDIDNYLFFGDDFSPECLNSFIDCSTANLGVYSSHKFLLPNFLSKFDYVTNRRKLILKETLSSPPLHKKLNSLRKVLP